METAFTDSRTRSGILSYFSLFTSFGTLLCCALPSLFVLFGLGATVASVLSAVPWLVYLSRHKNWVFVIAGLLIAGNFVYVYRIAPRFQLKNGTCGIDDPAACQRASRFSRVVLWTSGILYLIGCFSAYVLGPLLVRLDT